MFLTEEKREEIVISLACAALQGMLASGNFHACEETANAAVDMAIATVKKLSEV